MRKLKITVIGAGSTYTPELIQGFINRKKSLSLNKLYLMDIDLPKLKIVSGLVKRMLEHRGMEPEIVITENLEESIAGADYIISQIRVGNLEARILDEKIPLKYDLLGQETTGIGGMFKALRTIPEIKKIADLMSKSAPNAWLINFSNPSGLVAEAIMNTSNINMIGLCNGPINMIDQAKELIPKGYKEFDYDFIGLNHLCWITGIYADGKDIFPEICEKGLENDLMKNIPQAIYDPVLLKATRGLPISYLNYFYFREEQLQKAKDMKKSRGEVCQEIEMELLKQYKDTNLFTAPEKLSERGGALYSEAAVSIIDSIENDLNDIHVVDIQNNGALDFMQSNDVVEIKARINKQGASPIKVKGFSNSFIMGMMQAVKAYEKLAAQAALEGDYHKAIAALMVNPLVGDYNKAIQAFDEMYNANKKYLGQFNKTWDRG